MARVIWSGQASRDIDDICTHIGRTSEAYARNFAARVWALVETLADQPLIGSVVPEYDDEDIRERQHHNHRFIYRVRADEIVILTGHPPPTADPTGLRSRP